MKIILGSGYVGQALYEADPTWLRTSRQPGKEIQFNFHDTATWQNISGGDFGLMSFAMDSVRLAQAFATQVLPRFKHFCILSSTGFFLPDSQGIVTEDNPLDLQLERVQCEEILFNQGAQVLHLAGIYGPGRNPLDWLKSGRVKDLWKWVNLIHRDDIVQFVEALVSYPNERGRFIASDDQPMIWKEIAESLGISTATSNPPSVIQGKRVNSQASKNRLKIKLKFPNVISGVKSLR